MKNRIREMVLLSALLAIPRFRRWPRTRPWTVAATLRRRPPPVPAREAGIVGRARRTKFFPHNWVRGYVGFDVAPSHNEPDLGRCSPVADRNHQPPAEPIPTATPTRATCWAAISKCSRSGKRSRATCFVFFTPTFSFGNNVPQFKYTASMAGIAFERAVGVGIELPKNFEIRVTQHQVDWLGKYNNNVGLADLGTSGPYGLYTTIGARWYFGGYGRSREGR